MDVLLDASPPPEQEGGSRTRRRKATGGGGRRTRSSGFVGSDPVEVEKIPQLNNSVTSGGSVSVSVSVKPVTPTPVPVSVAPINQTGGGGGVVTNPKVVIAPPKKRPPKLLLVPGQRLATAGKTAALQKTFKAHKVRVLIDNTVKTQRRRRHTLQAVEAMTEDQLRAAAVAARLSRRETVAKVPVDLLRQMLKDYRVMRGMLL